MSRWAALVRVTAVGGSHVASYGTAVRAASAEDAGALLTHSAHEQWGAEHVVLIERLWLSERQ